MTSNITDKDKEDWKNFLEKKEKLPNKDLEKKDNKLNTTKSVDLHGFTLDQANSKVKELILFCVENKYKEILLITGKGTHSTNDNDVFVSKDLGKIKYSVPEFIKSNDELNKFIISVNDADKKEGGEGAILISLKNL